MVCKLVIDTCSLINFFKYYYFDKYHGNRISKQMTEFIISKIKADEIIVIDKVDNEFLAPRDTPEFKKEMKGKILDTTSLLAAVRKLSENYRIKDNEKFFNNDLNQINGEIDKFENEYADLFLIALCNSINDGGGQAILITEETTNSRENRKLFPKIPAMCRIEGIEYRNFAYLLFEIYKNELKFDLNIINPAPAKSP